MFHRMKQVREYYDLTQKAFGESLGVSRDVYANIENGRVEPRDTFLKLLVKTYHVNLDWLYTGEGDMFGLPSAEEAFIRVMTEIQLSDDEFIRSAIRAYWELEPSERAAIRKLTRNMLGMKDQ